MSLPQKTKITISGLNLRTFSFIISNSWEVLYPETEKLITSNLVFSFSFKIRSNTLGKLFLEPTPNPKDVESPITAIRKISGALKTKKYRSFKP